MVWELEVSERRELRRLLGDTDDVRVCRRCSALLSLDRGEAVKDVARDSGVSRQTLYNWRGRPATDVGMADAARSGRPSGWTAERRDELRRALRTSPREFGFHAVSWTAGLLRAHLERVLDWTVSESSVRRELHALGYVWKRFRYTLRPDPEREKKRPDPQANRGVAGAERGAVRGRDRRHAVPAAAVGMGQTG